MRPLIGVTPDLRDNRYSVHVSYLAALFRSGSDAVVLPCDMDLCMLDRLNGVLISGGDDIHPGFYGEDVAFEMKLIERSRTEFEITIFRECLSRKMPVLGICNGMQLMNVALEGTLYQDIGTSLPLALDHKSGYHTINMFSGHIIPQGKYTVNTSHHQSIRDAGKGISVLAESEDGIIEAISVDGHPFALGVQWHPEKDCDDPLSKLVFERFREACLET